MLAAYNLRERQVFQKLLTPSDTLSFATETVVILLLILAAGVEQGGDEHSRSGVAFWGKLRKSTKVSGFA